ncbi:MAG: YbgC/FadM family acyl-CoA thioesterase [Pseudomonadota bacterium]
MNRQDFRFFHPLRVRRVEVDMQKIVFNAHYLMYFDSAISDYWRAMALPYEEAMHALEGDLYVKKASLEYHASARFDDRLDVALKCSRIGNSSMVFTGGIFRGDELLISSELIYVFADPVFQRSRPVPEGLRNVLAAFEARSTMTTVKSGSWQELGTDASRLRTEVFVEEQGIPVAMEWDKEDATAIHAVAYNRIGMPVATGRLLQHDPQTGRVGRMAVKRVLRGAQLGCEILHTLMNAAKARGDREIMLHAQRGAEAFYARSGFLPRGEPFEEAGIPHIEMFRRF